MTPINLSLLYKMTRWTDFIREWAGDNDISYACALSKPEMKEAYWSKYPKPKTMKALKAQQNMRDVAQKELMNISSKAKDQLKAKVEEQTSRKAFAKAKAEAAIKAYKAVKSKAAEVKAPEPVKRKRQAAPKWVAALRKELRGLTTKELIERLDESGGYADSLDSINKDRAEQGKKPIPEENYRRDIIQNIILNVEEYDETGELEVPDANRRTNIKA